MININEVINIYNQFDINVLDGSALREDLFLKDIIFSFIKSNYLDKNPKSYFPKSRSMIPNFYSPFTKDKVSDWRKTQKKLTKFLKSKKNSFWMLKHILSLL